MIQVARVVLVLLASHANGLHKEPAKLLGYSCKDNAQRPCELCEPGFFCDDKHSKNPCGGPNKFCPLGSYKPTLTQEGYYSIGGNDNTTRVDEKICEPGSVCIDGVMLPCPIGHYCPKEGTSEPIECGDASVYCEEGSIEPKRVEIGYFSVGTSATNTTQSGQKIAPAGFYAINGVLQECHAGHYGSSQGLSDDNCSGICEAGWYCPSASVNPRQIACGGEEFFCPKGSAAPQKVRTGYHTSEEGEPCRPGMYRDETPNFDVSVSSIATSRLSGKCVHCPEGTFKHLPGDDMALCQKCGPKAKSTAERITCECFQSATERLSKDLYFDVASLNCIDIANTKRPPDEMFQPNSQLTKHEEIMCEPGYFCQGGVSYKCPAGRYGKDHFETRSECSGSCQEGYWCGEASTKATQNACGGPNVYCPKQSAAPKYVSIGYYTDEDEPHDRKTLQRLCPRGSYCPGDDGLRYLCPEGRYGADDGLSKDVCSGFCEPGYYCPPGSTSGREMPCGNSTVYCPGGSGAPILVDKGYYSASTTDIISSAGPNSTHDMQLECEIGYYCFDGIKYSCPGGTFGWFTGASDVSDCKPCRAGFYCPSHPGPPSTQARQVACGESYLYCPAGSPAPLPIDVGYYGIGGEFAATTEEEVVLFRTSQEICPPGFYCRNGLKFKCQAGTYGETKGLVDTHCSGLCPRGWFCPENSVHPLPCSPGSYSTGGAAECTDCEVPLQVSMDMKNSMCRNDRSCCFDLFE